MRSLRLSLCSALLGLCACSAVVTPDPSRLGGDVDAGRPVLMLDAYVPPGVDAALPATPDAFVPPVLDAFSPPTVDAFTPMTCEPGATSCSRDGSGVVTCNESGTSLGYTRCPMGCDASTARCRGASSVCPGLPSIAVGETRRVDLCASDDTTTPMPAEGCGAGSRADSGDVTLALAVASRSRVTLDLRDVDGTVGIDTVVSIRRACDDPASQLACSDDVPCAESDITSGCSGGVQVRQSRVTVDLEPGTYYLVLDAYEYDAFECGLVELRVTSG